MNCPVCMKRNVRYYSRFRDRLYGIKGEFDYSICLNCNAIFQDPMLDPKELSKFYPSNYVSFNKETQRDERNKMISLLYDTYYSQKGKWFHKLLFLPVKGLLRSLPKIKNSKLLDVGCGDGKFLKYVKQNGVIPYGVDPHRKQADNELNILNKDIFDAKFEADFFDVITLNNVLEHLTDIYGVLKECKRVLKHGGKLIINIPNTASLNYRLFGKNWVSLDPPRHTILFNSKNIKILSKNLGLRIKKINYLSEPFTLIGSNEYRKGETKLDGNKRLASKFLNILVMPYSLLTNIFRIGDQIEVVLEKP